MSNASKAIPSQGPLSLGVLMAVEADPCGVGEVGGELDEQRAEVLVHQVEVVVVAHHRAAGKPGIGLTGVHADPFGDAEGGEPFLRRADVEHALGGTEGLEALAGDLVLALPLLKGDDLHPLVLGEVMDCLNEGMGHGCHQRGRGHLGPPMALEEGRHPTAGLQHGLVQVQVQPVDPFDVQDDLPLQHLTHGLSYHDRRPRLTLWRQATRRFARLPTGA